MLVDVTTSALAEVRRAGVPARLALVGDGESRAESEALSLGSGVGDRDGFVGYRLDLHPRNLRYRASAGEGGAMKVFLTGGADFISNHIAEPLCRESYAVRVLDKFPTGHRRNLRAPADHVELVEGDNVLLAARDSGVRRVHYWRKHPAGELIPS